MKTGGCKKNSVAHCVTVSAWTAKSQCACLDRHECLERSLARVFGKTSRGEHVVPGLLSHTVHVWTDMFAVPGQVIGWGVWIDTKERMYLVHLHTSWLGHCMSPFPC